MENGHRNVKVLVTFALENEFAAWRKRRLFREAQWGEERVYATEIDGASVGVLLTGMGPDRAGAAAAGVMWIEWETIDFCLSAGLAGSLRPEFQVGDVVAARAVVSGETRAGSREREIQCDPTLVSLAAARGAKIVDRFFRSNHVVGTAEEKRRLGELAGIVEMESFEVLLEAGAFSIRAVAIRAISDGADDNLPIDMNRILSEQGDVSIPRVVGQIARRPQSLPGLVRLGQRSRDAAEALAEYLDGYLIALVKQMGAQNIKSTVVAG